MPSSIEDSSGALDSPGSDDPCEKGQRLCPPPLVLRRSPSPDAVRRGSFPLDKSSYGATSSSDSETPESAPAYTGGERKKQEIRRRTHGSLNWSPRSEYGIPLGTPAAKEAAKSFWSADMLQQSLDKIAQYADQSRSTSPSLSLSLGSSTNSIDNQSLSCESSSIHLPTIDVPASSSPSQREKDRSSPRTSPLVPLTAITYSQSSRRGSEGIGVSLPGSLNTSPRLSPSLHTRHYLLGRVTPPFLSPGATRKVHSAHTRKLAPLQASLSVEGKQLKLSNRLLPLRKSSSFNSGGHVSVRRTLSENNRCASDSLTPDDGFHE